MPAAKFFLRTLVVTLMFTTPQVYAENCEPSSVDLMRITGDEDFSAIGQVAALASTTTRAGHVWESSRLLRVQQAARTAKVATPVATSGAQAPAVVSTVQPTLANGSSRTPTNSGQSLAVKPAASKSQLTSVDVSVRPATTVSSVRSVTKPQIKAIRVQTTRKIR